ncbi:unnamed protein product [Rotaria sordida]|uniref:BTB domain-containing protein n=1 Tax=Rotaria sordida TaxID=392033 RepID=A0A819GD68_9BILA|nr:unnamed protein product [Rotaria sordida]CAF3884249.1 unnamed protein product [Rotaria sordida]
MSSPIERPSNDNDEYSRRRESPSQKRQSVNPSNFVLGRSQTPPGRVNNSQQGQRLTNGGVLDNQTSDADHNRILLKNLADDLSNLLNRTDISDCFLNVKGTFMAVHKCILAARSNAFAAVISANFNRLPMDERNRIQTMSDTEKLTIVIDKTDPEIMKEVVIFMYTGQCALDEGNAYALLDAAGRYDIKSLKLHTGRFLANRIDTNNVLMLLKAAYRYDNKLIKQRCIEYFINHAKEVMAIHETWKRFAEEQQPIVAELLHWLVNKDLFYSEKPQWEAASRW